MPKSKILIQLDSDRHTSTFDSVVAIDAEVAQLLRHSGVEPDDVESLVHGAIFTRGPDDLKNTAIFVGGKDMNQGERLLGKICDTFLGPLSVSVMLDANGSNTTAAAAVLCAEKHISLCESKVAVLGGTGPVGQRIARLAARKGAQVMVGSRRLDRSESVCQQLAKQTPSTAVSPFSTNDPDWVNQLAGIDVLFGAGAAGRELISSDQLGKLPGEKILVDLNAVPPAGIPGVDVMASASAKDGNICYGAIGVGALKMKIHKSCIRLLFTANNLVLDAEQIYDAGAQLV
ncbi:MAG: methylene-tetrahydromethanopterin dehydrogenase N-terminal domain-containing protein [Planctomycetota bacterium]|nr:methylene-tetrahydromethanopterin dehydrogenase N-terminal domain-containing protein [Planctomycetota bacterium]